MSVCRRQDSRLPDSRPLIASAFFRLLKLSRLLFNSWCAASGPEDTGYLPTWLRLFSHFLVMEQWTAIFSPAACVRVRV